MAWTTGSLRFLSCKRHLRKWDGGGGVYLLISHVGQRSWVLTFSSIPIVLSFIYVILPATRSKVLSLLCWLQIFPIIPRWENELKTPSQQFMMFRSESLHVWNNRHFQGYCADPPSEIGELTEKQCACVMFRWFLPQTSQLLKSHYHFQWKLNTNIDS